MFPTFFIGLRSSLVNNGFLFRFGWTPFLSDNDNDEIKFIPYMAGISLEYSF
ncbi:MAG: hypothetical protein ACHQFW_08645 [Chitinophagales bacterium]